jgi:YVTN family beta-propeller protein
MRKRVTLLFVAIRSRTLLSLILIVSLIITGLLYLGSAHQIAKAQQQTTVSYSDDFSTDSGLWTYLGNAYREILDNTLVLNKGEWYQRGIVFFNHPISSSFTVSFSYLIGEGYAGLSGDALIMFFYTPNNSTLLGAGPASQSNSGYGIEFDGWPNWASDFVGLNGGLVNPPTGDPYDNHIALIEGSVGNHIAYTAKDPRVSDYIWHHAIVQVDESSVSVYVDDDLVLQWNGTLNRAYSGFGFAGLAGGGATNYHVMDDFSITFDAGNDVTANPTPTVPSRIYTVIETISPFGKPCSVAFSPDGAYAYVANAYGDDLVSVISTVSNKVTERIRVGNNPCDVAVSPDGAYVYVAIDRYWSNWWHNGSVSVINTTTNKVETSIPIGYNANVVAVSPDGAYVYVANKGESSVAVINTTTNTVAATALVGSNVTDVAVSPNGAYVYVAGDNLVSVVNTATNKLKATIAVGSDACAVAISPDGAYAYVTNKGDDSVSVINSATNKVTATIPVGSRPCAVALSPNGAHAYVANRDDSSVSVINATTNTVNTTITLDDPPWGFVPVVLPSGLEEYVVSSKEPVRKEPCGVAVSPDGQYAYVTNYYSLTVSVISLAETWAPPSIISPENITYSTNEVPLTFTASEKISSIYYSVNGEANVSISGNTTLTGLSDGSYSIVVYANDTNGNTKASEIVNFSVDTPPTVSVLSPQNVTYNSASIPLNFTVNQPVKQISYSLDTQNSISIAGNTTLTDLPSGPHNLTVYATDETDNIGASETICFTRSKKDGTSPVFSDSTILLISALAITAAAIIVLVYLWKRKH